MKGAGLLIILLALAGAAAKIKPLTVEPEKPVIPPVEPEKPAIPPVEPEAAMVIQPTVLPKEVVEAKAQEFVRDFPVAQTVDDTFVSNQALLVRQQEVIDAYVSYPITSSEVPKDASMSAKTQAIIADAVRAMEAEKAVYGISLNLDVWMGVVSEAYAKDISVAEQYNLTYGRTI